MSTMTLTGLVSYPIATGGPSASLYVGSPLITPSSSNGFQLTYDESAAKTMYVEQGDGVVSIGFDTISDADFVYIGTDQPIDLKLDGSATAISLVAGGFIIVAMASIVSATVQATTADAATITVLLLGDTN